MNPFPQDGSEENKKYLFQSAMKSKWEEVINKYIDHQELHTAKITSSGDTALHIAISNGAKDSVVEKLVEIVSKTEGTLATQNEIGNTPLHLAAYLGNANMCRCIARREYFSTLMGIRNGENETPFFLAVRHGRKEAFYALDSICGADEERYKYCRGKDGETILHSAIYGEYFDLAFYIMTRYDKLLNAMNELGVSPLHILANKPSAFRSGSHIRGLHKLIYHCIFVDELQDNKIMRNQGADLQYKKEANYPENYHTCLKTFDLLWGVMRLLLGYSREKHIKKEDEENPKGHQNKLMGYSREKHINEEDEENPKEHQNKLMGYSREKHDENIKKEYAKNPKRHQIVDILMMVLCGTRKADDERHQFEEANKKAKESTKRKAQGHEFLPKNYINFFNFVKLISKVMLVILGLGSKSVDKIKAKKTKHIWSIQLMEKLLEHASLYQYEDNGKSPTIIPQGGKDTQIPSTVPDIATVEGNYNPTVTDEKAAEPVAEKSTNNKAADISECGKCKEMLCSVLNSVGLVKGDVCGKGRVGSDLDMEKKETPILIAARSGVVEMLEGILERFPVAIHDMNVDKKNVVLLAVEHRQPHVYKFLLDCKNMKDTIFRKTDKNGNSALHLAARLSEHKPWLIPGAALQMQWEMKWYEFVKDSMPINFFPRNNKDSKTPRDIFNETHDKLTKEGGEWLVSTSQSCSVVAALIATVAFATSATVPGGVKDDNSGTPTLQNQPAFSIFAISSLVALCFSVTSVIMFLAILTSRFQERDFRADLPRKLLVGLTSLFVSIGSMLLSFCAGHFFVLKNKLQYAAFPMYAITCLPVTFFAINQFPLYFDLVSATFRKLPQRSFN